MQQIGQGDEQGNNIPLAEVQAGGAPEVKKLSDQLLMLLYLYLYLLYLHLFLYLSTDIVLTLDTLKPSDQCSYVFNLGFVQMKVEIGEEEPQIAVVGLVVDEEEEDEITVALR